MMCGFCELMKSGGASGKSSPIAGAVSVTGNKYIDALTWGSKWDNGVPITYTFADDQRPWTADERQAFEEAMDTYESVIDVSFTEVFDPDDANLVFHSVGNNWLDFALGMQTGPDAGSRADGYYNWQGDGWNPDGLEKGGYGYTTVVHELGHALGLAHPHDDGGGSSLFPKVKGPYSKGLYGQNQGLYTVMSYNDLNMKWSPSHPEAGYGFIAGPMAFDIAALQNIYGANNGFNTGDDVYQLPNVNGGGTFYAAIWDTSGVDTLDFDGFRPATLDLRPAPLEGRHAGGFLSTAKKIHGGLIIANGVTIENADGGAAGDRIFGNDVSNNLAGNEGRDRLVGYYGNDTLDGGTGRDTMIGGHGDDVYYVDNHKDSVKEVKDGGNDTIYSSSSYSLSGRSVETLTMIGSDDVNAAGNGLDNVLNGNDGANRLNGKDGVDTMTGGDGNDTYVVGQVDDVIVEAPGEGTDSVESYIDYVLADELENLQLKGQSAINATGNDAANILNGNSRSNNITGGIGNDTIDGGRGRDTAFFSGDRADFTLHLGSDTIGVEDTNAADGDEGNNILTRVEYLWFADGLYEVFSDVFIPFGTAANDSMVGSDYNNLLVGLTGDDTLSAGAGNDTLDGGDGNDSLDGGTGRDVMTGGMGDDTFFIDSKYDRVYEDAGGGTDTVISEKSIKLAAHVEVAIVTGAGKGYIRGNGENNLLTGGPGRAKIYGRDGSDTISGGDGNDTLYGGDGADSIVGGNGDNKIYGNDGADTVSSGNGNDYLSGGDGADSVTGGDGNDKIYGGDEGDTLSGGTGNDYISSGDGGDSVSGGDGDDKIYGSYGADIIAGEAGNDTLFGGRGNDTLDGGAGRDIMDGGKGDDRFVYTDIADSAAGDETRDSIKYFEKYGDDLIDLSLIDADETTGGDQAFSLIGEAAFSGMAGELRYGSGLVQADVDGDGLADFEITVNTKVLEAEDFLL